GEGGAQRQTGRQRRAGDTHQARQGNDQPRMPGDPSVITPGSGLGRRRHGPQSYQGFSRRGRPRFTNCVSVDMLNPMRTIGLISPRPGLAVMVATLVLPAVVLLTPAPALAVGESITDVRILGNQRTEEDTVRSIAGVKIGGTLELDTLELARERLH